MVHKRTTWIEWRGERRSLVEWSRLLGIGYNVVRLRLQRGWSVDRALTEPVKVPGFEKNPQAGRDQGNASQMGGAGN